MYYPFAALISRAKIWYQWQFFIMPEYGATDHHKRQGIFIRIHLYMFLSHNDQMCVLIASITDGCWLDIPYPRSALKRIEYRFSSAVRARGSPIM